MTERAGNLGENTEQQRNGERWWAAAGDHYDSQVESLTMLQFPRSPVHLITHSLTHTLTTIDEHPGRTEIHI